MIAGDFAIDGYFRRLLGTFGLRCLLFFSKNVVLQCAPRAVRQRIFVKTNCVAFNASGIVHAEEAKDHAAQHEAEEKDNVGKRLSAAILQVPKEIKEALSPMMRRRSSGRKESQPDTGGMRTCMTLMCLVGPSMHGATLIKTHAMCHPRRCPKRSGWQQTLK
jgi:hypothetical protein